MKWDINAENSAVEKVKGLDGKVWFERFVDRLAIEFRPDKEQLEVYLAKLRNEST
jgi:hypothetical protein